MKNIFASIGIALALLAPVVARAEYRPADPDGAAHPEATGETLDGIDDAFSRAHGRRRLPSYLRAGISGEEMDAHDSEAFRAASEAVAAAPSFCASVVVEPDATHRYRAVCILEGSEEPVETYSVEYSDLGSLECESNGQVEVCIGEVAFL